MKKIRVFCSTFLLFLVFTFINFNISAQIVLNTSTEINMVCNGVGCNYTGPTILINEVMLCPTVNDGSIYGTGPGFSTGQNEGEWIELYNPDQCKAIDISCYFLGNNAADNSTNYGGGFTLPPNTIIPARGFCIVRGINAPAVPSNLLVQNGGRTVEIVVGPPRVCIGGGARLWFPNAGGWFAFYDRNGVPQDAISWASNSNSCMTCAPCNPGGCAFTGTLPSYDQIPANIKNYISTSGPTTGQTFRRFPDGGSWQISTPSTPTYGNCNGTCIPQPIITCNGTATVNASGGTPPYTYAWDDGMAQTTETATGLCAGQYCVTVSDADGITATTCVTITNYIPTVTMGQHDPVCLNQPAFSWPDLVPSGGVLTGSGTSGTSFDPISAGLGTHTLTYTYTDTNTCTNATQATISVGNISGSATVTQHVLCFGESTGVASAIGSSGNEPYSYTWSTTPAQSNAVATNLSAGQYTVTISDSYGCSTAASVNVQQSPQLTMQFTAINESCFQYCNGQLTAGVSGGIPPYQYSWSNGASTQSSIQQLCPGNYSVTVSDSANCQINASQSIITETFIDAAFTHTPDIGIAPASMTFISVSTGAHNYFWTFGDGNSANTSTAVNLYSNPGSYYVTLVVNSGPPNFCVDSISTTVIVQEPSQVTIPNVFTPNGDGSNDFFFALSEGLETELMIIFNRWGRRVFEWNTVGGHWDGKNSNGTESAEGVYYFVFQGKGYDNVIYNQHGSITLMR